MLAAIRELVRNKLPILTMSADCYQRYKFVSGILEKEGCDTILDVGGGKDGFFKRFLLDKKSWTVDPDGGDIIGDGRSLPFEKNSFDAVAALETLQYIDAKDRKKFIKELIRTAKKCVVLTLPLESPKLSVAELECNNLHKSLFGKGNRWLDEHIKNGLPNIKDMEKLLSGYTFEVYNICQLRRWKKMLKTNFILQKMHLTFLSPIVNALYVLFYGVDSKEPSYTKVFCIKGVN